MKIYTQNDNLVVQFQGFEVLWAFKRQLVIPFINIESLKFYEQWQKPKNGPWLRLGGTFMPNVLMAGRYRVHGQAYFAYVKGVKSSSLADFNAVNVAAIKTHDYPYTQVFLSVKDAAELPKL